MPIVAHSSLPTFAVLSELGHDVLSLDRAERQDIRELHIGFLNMMPDSALQATERQFIRLVGSCNRIAQFFVYPFSLPELERGADAQAYIDQHYHSFEDLCDSGLDALIITGANVANPALPQEAFWEPLMAVVDWAEQHVASILCSCLATHALLERFHAIKRQPLPSKRWGVYAHRVRAVGHPLLRDINTRFDAPHSRFNDISARQMTDAGLTVLAQSEEGGVHLAVSPDQFRVVYFQGHPEYDFNSLFKEFKREVVRYSRGERNDMPPYPQHYFDEESRTDIEQFVREIASNGTSNRALEKRIEARLANTWGDTAKSIFNNWLGWVYQLTSHARTGRFMESVDPEDPLRCRTTFRITE